VSGAWGIEDSLKNTCYRFRTSTDSMLKEIETALYSVRSDVTLAKFECVVRYGALVRKLRHYDLPTYLQIVFVPGPAKLSRRSGPPFPRT
jgi:hypothetical protein